MQVRPELCLDININDVANEIQAIPGVTLIHALMIYPGTKLISFRGNPGPELLNDQRFVDHNATSVDSNAEVDKVSGHTAQIGENDTDILTASQIIPTGLQRTILDLAFPDNTLINTAENVTTTNATLTNASSLATGCEMYRALQPP